MVVEGDPAGATGDPTGGVPTASSWSEFVYQLAAAAEDEQELELCRILGDEPAAEAADDATSSQRYQVHFAPPTPPAAAHAPRKIATPPPRRRGAPPQRGGVSLPAPPGRAPAQFAPHIPAPAPEAAHTPPADPPHRPHRASRARRRGPPSPRRVTALRSHGRRSPCSQDVSATVPRNTKPSPPQLGHEPVDLARPVPTKKSSASEDDAGSDSLRAGLPVLSEEQAAAAAAAAPPVMTGAARSPSDSPSDSPSPEEGEDEPPEPSLPAARAQPPPPAAAVAAAASHGAAYRALGSDGVGPAEEAGAAPPSSLFSGSLFGSGALGGGALGGAAGGSRLLGSGALSGSLDDDDQSGLVDAAFAANFEKMFAGESPSSRLGGAPEGPAAPPAASSHAAGTESPAEGHTPGRGHRRTASDPPQNLGFQLWGGGAGGGNPQLWGGADVSKSWNGNPAGANAAAAAAAQPDWNPAAFGPAPNCPPRSPARRRRCRTGSPPPAASCRRARRRAAP